MKLEDLPEFARKYKRRGYDVRLRNGSYSLVKIWSRRESGRKYPMLHQEYVGIIDPAKGLLPKMEKPDPKRRRLECGLSRFLLANFRRDLQAASPDGDPKLIRARLAIVFFIYGQASARMLALTAMEGHDDPELIEAAGRIPQGRISELSKKLWALIVAAVPDESDRLWLLGFLRQMTVRDDAEGAALKEPEGIRDPMLLEVLGRYGLKI